MLARLSVDPAPRTCAFSRCSQRSASLCLSPRLWFQTWRCDTALHGHFHWPGHFSGCFKVVCVPTTVLSAPGLARANTKLVWFPGKCTVHVCRLPCARPTQWKTEATSRQRCEPSWLCCTRTRTGQRGVNEKANIEWEAACTKVSADLNNVHALYKGD